MSARSARLLRTPSGRPIRYLTRSVTRNRGTSESEQDYDNLGSARRCRHTSNAIDRHRQIIIRGNSTRLFCRCLKCTTSIFRSFFYLFTKPKFIPMIVLAMCIFLMYSNYDKFDTFNTDTNKDETPIVKIVEYMKNKIEYLEKEVSVVVSKIRNSEKSPDIVYAHVDLSSQSLGGKVLEVFPKESIHSSRITNWIWNSISIHDSISEAQIILQSTGAVVPGECWAFEGSEGMVMVQLIGNVYISGISIEHISADVSPTMEISSAPKKFRLIGLNDRKDNAGFNFGTFEYNKEGKPLQTFDVKFLTTQSYPIVKLIIESNWGNKCHTCLYKIQIHGVLQNKKCTIV